MKKAKYEDFENAKLKEMENSLKKMGSHNEIRSSELEALRKKKTSKAEKDKQARTGYLEKVTKEVNLMEELENEIAALEEKESEILRRLGNTRSTHQNLINDFSHEHKIFR